MSLRNYVIRLAQPGFDAETAGDENLIYNSEWPLFPIYKSDTVHIDDASKDYVLCEHDLGYPAAFWPITVVSYASWASTTMTPEARAEFMGRAGQYVGSKKNKLTYYGSLAGFTGSMDITYYLFAIDLTQEFKAPIISIGDPPPADAPFVFKLTKDGKDIDSDDLSDFAIHSDGRSPLLHSVNPGANNENLGGAGFAFTVFHNLTYNPIFFLYVDGSNTPSGTYGLFPSGAGGSTVVEVDNQIVRFRQALAGQKMTFIVCKDPFNVTKIDTVKI